jgi:hypothetical protein
VALSSRPVGRTTETCSTMGHLHISETSPQ